MTRKFECKNCGKHFEADDSKMVNCPHCQSDNVEIAGFKISPLVWKVGAAVLALAILVVIFYPTKGKEKEIVEVEEIVGAGDENAERSDTSEIVPGLDIPPTIEVGKMSFEGNGYSFKVTAKNAPVSKTYIAILDPFDNAKRIAKSDDGTFKDVPSSDVEGAFYTIALLDAATDSIICSIEKPGFIKQTAVATKMTVSELQQKIDSRDNSLLGAGENDYLAPDYKLKFVGLPADAVNIPTILAEVTDKLDMETWVSAKVTALDYDDKNRISVITLKVELP